VQRLATRFDADLSQLLRYISSLDAGIEQVANRGFESILHAHLVLRGQAGTGPAMAAV
jgi:hypothetical protein